MKRKIVVSVFFLCSISSICLGQQTQAAPLYQLDPDLPGLEVKPFANGEINSFMDDFAITFSPDGEEIYYTVTGRTFPAIVKREYREGRWLSPELVTFSGQHPDYAPEMSPDGSYMFFCSRRLISEKDSTHDQNIWMVHREGDKWGAAVPLPEEVNGETSQELWPSIAPGGDLYFASNREGGRGGYDIYVSRYTNGKYQSAENLGPVVNSEHEESCPFIARDGSYLIIEIIDKPGGHGGGDMYIIRRQEDGSWGEPVNLGEKINSRSHDCYPKATPDGQYLIFMSERRQRLTIEGDSPTFEKIKSLSMTCGGWDFFWISEKTIHQP